MEPEALFLDLAQTYQQIALESCDEKDLAHAKRYRLAAEEIIKLRAALKECVEAMTHTLAGSLSLPRFAEQDMKAAITYARSVIGGE